MIVNIKKQALALSAAILCLAVLPLSVEANSPQSVAVEYDAASGKLNVTIAHASLDTSTHYIAQVVIERNAVVNITADYTTQPTNDVFTYTYLISAVDGDVLRATAKCSLFGENSASLTVSTAPPPDFVIPTVHIVKPANLQIFNTSGVVVNGTAADNVAVAKVELSLNNGTWQAASGKENWSAPVTLSPGPNFIRARATDTSNNTGQDFVYVTFINDTGPQPDTTPPSISISAPLEGQTVNVSRIDVRGASSDESGVRLVEVRLNRGTWENATGNLSWNATFDLLEGSNIIEARATDFANNTASASVNVTYTNQTGPPPDTVRPVIAIAQPSEGRTFNVTTVNVAGTASDDAGLAKVEIRVNSGAWKAASGTSAWSSSVTLVNGSNRVDARATDTSGNTATASVNVTYEAPAPPPPPPPPVDTTPPSISITSPPDGTIFTSADVTVNGTASDNVRVARVEVRVGTGAWGLASGTANWTILLTLAEGKNTIEARAADGAGNIRNASISVLYARPGGTSSLDGTISSGEYDHKASFSGGAFELHWKVSGDTILVAMVGRTTGWVAIGLEPTLMMKDADMIAGWVDSRGKPGVLDCYSTGPNGPHPPDTSFSPPGTNDIAQYGGSESAGTTTIEFTRLLRTGDRYDHAIPANGTLSFIWALGPGDDFNFQHLSRGYGTINLTTGASTEKTAMAWQPHAILMGAGVGLLLAGIFVARMKKQKWWLKGHRAVMLAGAALTASGLVYGYYMIQASTGVHFRVVHTYLGLLSILLTVSMAASGLVLLKLARDHPAARPAHRWLGRITIVVLVLTVIMGLVQAGVITLG
jgi:uncharacterized membrane protein YozB (DUF420 family)